MSMGPCFRNLLFRNVGGIGIGTMLLVVAFASAGETNLTGCLAGGPLTFARPVTSGSPYRPPAFGPSPTLGGGWACGVCDDVTNDTCNTGKTPEGFTCKIFENAGGICVDGDTRSQCRIGGRKCGFFCRLIGCPRFCQKRQR